MAEELTVWEGSIDLKSGILGMKSKIATVKIAAHTQNRRLSSDGTVQVSFLGV